MEKFKETVFQKEWNYINAQEILNYIRLPDENNNLTLDVGFSQYAKDEFTYFYPPKDYQYYMSSKYELEFPFEGSINVNLDSLNLLLKYVKKDIGVNIDYQKYRYWFADKHEIKFKKQGFGIEWGSSSYIYDEDDKILGKVHKFSGNMGFTGHQECSKSESIRVTLYGDQEQIWFLDTENLKTNSILPITEGKVLFKKELIDLVRLEECELIEMMINFAKDNYGSIYISIL